eukprot:3290927-Amphidinium_carterae.1
MGSWGGPLAGMCPTKVGLLVTKSIGGLSATTGQPSQLRFSLEDYHRKVHHCVDLTHFGGHGIGLHTSG